MKVAFVMPGIGVVSRGAEAFVVELAAALEGRPVPLTAPTPPAGGSDVPDTWEVTLFCRGSVAHRHRRIRALPRDTRWLNALYSASRFGRKVLDTLFLDPLSVEWYTAALAAFPTLWRGGYDVVVMEGGLVGAWTCRLLRRLRGVPFVDVAHGVDPKWEGAFARQRPDRVVAFTAAAARMIAGRAPRARIAVVPHGIDLDSFHPGVEAADSGLPGPVVLVAGAVDEHKRTHAALRAVARLAERAASPGSTAEAATAAEPQPAPAPAPSLLVLGDGPLAADFDRRAAELLPPGRYRRLTVPRSEMARWYRAADVFTLPSRTESFGLTYLEALACGRPCVAPDDDVRREVVGDAGTFADPEDTDAYADALAAALAGVRDGTWGDLPRRRAERFPVGHTSAAWSELLAEVVREARLRHGRGRSAAVAGAGGAG